MPRFFILVESNTTGTGRLFAEAARRLGFHPIVLAQDPGRYPALQADGVEVLQTETGEGAGLRATLRHLAEKGELAGVYSSSEYFVAVAAAVAAWRGLPGASPDAVSECRNKWMQRVRLGRGGVAVPAYWHVTSSQDLPRVLDLAPLPVVVKPVYGTGSVGVRVCRTSAEASAHAAGLLGQRVNERGMPVPSGVLFEQYLNGPEYSVELLGRCVLGITRKYLSAEPVFVEMGHDFPAQLRRADGEALAATALRALEALGLGWGPSHVELRMTASGPSIVEVNPRLAGGFIPELIRLARGIDVIRETIRMAAGEAPDLQPRLDRRASIRFIAAQTDGVVGEATGMDAAASVPGVVDVQVYRAAGERAEVRGDFRDRLGHVIACTDSEEASIRAAETARSRIAIPVRAEQAVA